MTIRSFSMLANHKNKEAQRFGHTLFSDTTFVIRKNS